MKAGVLESMGFTYIYEDLEEALIDLV
jgi:hypothetical protein